jgi:hypothetical protein
VRWACRRLRAHGTKLAKQHRLAARMLLLPRHAADHAVPTFAVNSIAYNSQADHGDGAVARGAMHGHVKSVSARVQCGWSEGWPSRGVSATRKIMAKVFSCSLNKTAAWPHKIGQTVSLWQCLHRFGTPNRGPQYGTQKRDGATLAVRTRTNELSNLHVPFEQRKSCDSISSNFA